MRVGYTIKDKEKEIVLTNSPDGWKVIWDFKSDIQPLFDHVIVELDEQKEVSRGGILIPEDTRENSSTGVVIAVGEGAVNDKGETIPMFVKPGDRVFFLRDAGINIKQVNENQKMIRQTEILGILK